MSSVEDKVRKVVRAQLEDLRLSYERGHFPALMGAIKICGDDDPLPSWARDAAIEIFEKAYSGGSFGRRGRSGGLEGQTLNASKHRIRWAVATIALSIRDQLPKRVVPGEPGAPYAATRPGAFMFASDYLRGTRWQGAASAVEYSYDLQNRARQKAARALGLTFDPLHDARWVIGLKKFKALQTPSRRRQSW